jgi:hypothetical protein
MGARNGGMGNISELLINVVILNKPKVLLGLLNKPKVLLGLNQKVRGMVRGLLTSSTHSRIPPAKRQALTHRVK